MSAAFIAQWPNMLALAAAIGALWKYFQSRRDELAWRRTEILFKLGDRLDTDPNLSKAVDLLYDRFSGLHISQLFDENGVAYDNLHGEMLGSLDRLLNLLERVAHAHLVLRTLSFAEVQTLGGHFQSILLINRLQKYCIAHGYATVVALAEQIVAAQSSDKRRKHTQNTGA